jgi:predicted dehydrogenase
MNTYGITKDYDNYLDLLDAGLDIAMISCDNAFHVEVAEAALRRGIHVLMEKPMAPTLAGALAICRAARAGNAEIIVNWPSTWNPAFRLAKQLVDEGKIGKVFKLTYRNNASTGPFGYGQGLTDTEKGDEWWHMEAAGGGAFLDYCCYGACIASWFLGQPPIAAYGLKANFNSHYGDAEDYGAVMARYPEAVALLEGSWTTVASGIPSGPIVYGLEGTLVSGWSNKVDIYKSRYSLDPTESYEAAPLPIDRDNLAKEIFAHFEKGEALHPTLSLKVNMDAMVVLDTALRSAKSDKTELAGSEVWTIGK